MESLSEQTHSALDVVTESSWRIRANGGRAENVETGTTRDMLNHRSMQGNQRRRCACYESCPKQERVRY